MEGGRREGAGGRMRIKMKIKEFRNSECGIRKAEKGEGFSFLVLSDGGSF